jgi:hypothetical protein
MTDNVTIQISGSPAAVLRILAGFKSPDKEKARPRWATETPWFERHGKLTAEQAADMEVGFYGTRRQRR